MSTRTSGGPGRPSRRRADASASAARIVAASRRIFGSGRGAGSLEEIAAEAGVGIATLYRHFPNREALARAVYDDLLATELQPLLDEAEEAGSPRATLMTVAERLLDLLSQESGLIDMAGDFAGLTGEMLERVTAPLHHVLQRAQERGEIRADLVAEDIPRFLVMGVAGLTLPGTTRRTRERFLTLMFDALSPVGASELPAYDADEDRLDTAIRSIGPRASSG